ncbi:hypothetical protein ACE4Z5_24770, partial [Salmonella enterica]|uniref:hypothetical protein n=1 Tax=Salmonella enterica TaxID=28901 RepID=UPI003D28BEF8
EAVAIIRKRVLQDDPAYAEKIKGSATYYHPNGSLDVENVLSQLDFFKAAELVDRGIDGRRLIDPSFVPPLAK